MAGIKHIDVGPELTKVEFEDPNLHEVTEGAGAFPGGPAETDLFYRSDEHKWYIYNGTDWIDLTMVISDADAAVGEVKAGKTFYSVESPKKTGTMPTVAIVAGNDTYSAGYHAGDAGGLDAIDTDLAPANIKSGTNIFGKVGTLAVSQDLVTAVRSTLIGTTNNLYSQYRTFSVSTILATTTPTFAANSLAIGVATASVCRSSGIWYVRLEMDGVVMAQSANIADCTGQRSVVYYVLIASKALVGAKTCLCRLYESSAGSAYTLTNRYGDERMPACIAVGSVKL